MKTSQNSSKKAAQVTTAISSKDLQFKFNRPKEQEPEELTIEQKAMMYDEMRDEFADWKLPAPSKDISTPLLYLRDMYDIINTECNGSVIINRLSRFIKDNYRKDKDFNCFSITDAATLIEAMVCLLDAAEYIN